MNFVTPTRRRFRSRLSIAILSLLFVSVALVTTRSAAVPPAGPPQGSQATFRDFNGVNHFVISKNAQAMGLGWVRQDFDWRKIEKQKGQWDWTEPDSLVRLAQAQNVGFLPTLLHTPGWARTQGPPKNPPDVAPPDRVQDWEDFVEHVVARYSAAPYNLRYFQVWNEPTLQASFWRGKTNTDYIDLIYLPAAKIIRRHGCYVVFGGWPASNSLQELASILNYRNAIQWTDIVDVHYRSAADWQQLYNTWVATGKCRGVWQTETGFSPAPDFITGVYNRLLFMSLQWGWKNPDAYKLFYYAAWGSGSDGEKCLTKTGAGGQLVLSHNGVRLAVMNNLLGGGSLAPYTQFSASPSLPVLGTGGTGWTVGYRVGQNRVVIAFFVVPAAVQGHPAIPFTLSLPERPSSVQLVSPTGSQHWNLPSQYRGGRLQVAVPLRSGVDECPQCVAIAGYLVVDQ